MRHRQAHVLANGLPLGMVLEAEDVVGVRPEDSSQLTLGDAVVVGAFVLQLDLREHLHDGLGRHRVRLLRHALAPELDELRARQPLFLRARVPGRLFSRWRGESV